jgi:ankyrin repeat protein
LEKGADIDEIGVEDPTDKRTKAKMGTGLHKAVRAGHTEIVKLLLEKGADVNLKNVQGWTPLALAKEEDRKDITQLLESHGGK